MRVYLCDKLSAKIVLIALILVGNCSFWQQHQVSRGTLADGLKQQGDLPAITQRLDKCVVKAVTIKVLKITSGF